VAFIKEVINGVQVKRSDCNGSSLNPARTPDVGLEGLIARTFRWYFQETVAYY
jgi:hypothetical protein